MRIIAHIDMDAFYAAVEEQRNPELRSRPVVVGADPREGKGRGVVTTANYAARRFGIHSALPISRAWHLAERARRSGEPATVFIQPDFRLYREVSARIMAIFERAVDVYEQASIDEAYVDLSSAGDYGASVKRLKNLKITVRESEGLTCSIGIGPNKLIAKIASAHQKPDGLTLITPDSVQDFLSPLAIRVIPGIGRKTEAFLHARDIRAVRDLTAVSEADLIDWFGKWGQRLFECARGIDDSEVSNDWIRKSVGEQETFQEDTHDIALTTERLDAMAERVLAKLAENNFSGFRTITLTVRFSGFETKNRSRGIKSGMAVTGKEEALGFLREQARSLLLPFFDGRENPRGKAIRLIGLRLEKLF